MGNFYVIIGHTYVVRDMFNVYKYIYTHTQRKDDVDKDEQDNTWTKWTFSKFTVEKILIYCDWNMKVFYEWIKKKDSEIFR